MECLVGNSPTRLNPVVFDINKYQTKLIVNNYTYMQTVRKAKAPILYATIYEEDYLYIVKDVISCLKELLKYTLEYLHTIKDNQIYSWFICDHMHM